MKNVSTHQHDKTGSQQWTAVLLLLELVSTPAKEPTHINCKMTRSLYQVQYFNLNSLTCSCRVGVSKRFSRGIRMQSIAFIHILFWLIRSLVDPALAVFIVCGPLQLVTHRKNILALVKI